MSTSQPLHPSVMIAETGPTTRAAVMYVLALLFLAMLAVILPHGGVSEEFSELTLDVVWLPGLFLVLWIVIVVDGLAGLITAPDKWKAPLLRLLLTVLIPPFRMTICTAIPNHLVWLPRYGWQATGQGLYKQLELRLALPMLLITLLILPVIGAEVFLDAQVARSALLALTIHLVTAIIWFAFAYEFIVLVSVAEKKLDYCKQHWINIVIILLPLVAFLRTLQLFRFLRLAKAGKLVRAYRLRGVFARALRLALVFNLVERLLQRNSNLYIKYLEDKIAQTEEELDLLREKLREAQAKITKLDR